MLRATLKGMASRKARLVLTSLAVVLGTMFVAAAMILSSTMDNSVRGAISDALTDVDAVVTSANEAPDDFVAGAATVPADVADDIAAVDGVDSVSAAVEGAVNAIGEDGKLVGAFAPTIGLNWDSADVSEDEYVEMREGRGPAADDEAAVSAKFITDSGLEIGDTVTLYSYSADRADYTIVGVYGFTNDRDSLAGETQVAVTTPEAQRLITEGEDVYTTVYIYGDVDTEAIAAVVGDEYKVQTGEEASDEAAEGFAEVASFMQYIFLGFGLIAVFVSIFLIINTFTIIVAQRQRELALMRAIGAGRGQVVRSVLTEALVVGVIASTLGLGLGVLLGWGLSQLVSGWMFDGLAVELLVPASTLWALVVGIGVTLLSALMPAVRASRVPPVAAMRAAENPPKPLRGITIAGATVMAVGLAFLVLGLRGDLGDSNLLGVMAGVLISFIGATLLTPIISKPLVWLLGAAMAWTFPGRLGRLNASRNPRRTAITAAALMIAVALVTSIASLASSVRVTAEEAMEENLNSDLVVSGAQTGANVPTFSRDTLAEIKALPEVASVGDMTADYFGAEINGEEAVLISSEDITAVMTVFETNFTEGSMTGLDANGVIVDENWAEDQGLGLGDTVEVAFSKGEEGEVTTLTIAGITEAEGSTTGGGNSAWVSFDHIDQFAIPKPMQAFIDVTAGADTVAVQDQVREILADEPEVSVTNNAEFVEQQTAFVDIMLGSVQVLLALAMIIAVIGVVNTLVLSVLERTRELGMLRAVGMTRGQARRMITVESIIICLFGAVLGIGVGIGLGWAVQQGLESEGLTSFALPWSLIVVYLIAAVIVGLLAAIAPAARAAKLNVLGAIAYE